MRRDDMANFDLHAAEIVCEFFADAIRIERQHSAIGAENGAGTVVMAERVLGRVEKFLVRESRECEACLDNAIEQGPALDQPLGGGLRDRDLLLEVPDIGQQVLDGVVRPAQILHQGRDCPARISSRENACNRIFRISRIFGKL